MGNNTTTVLNNRGWIDPPMDGLELRFSSRDVWIVLKRTEDIIHVSNAHWTNIGYQTYFKLE